MTKTVGISQKLLDPVKVAVGALGYNWITTGVFDRNEAGLAFIAVLGLLFGFLQRPDQQKEVVDGEG
jgi:hypothetical protein